jgi:diaminopimelate decarboxylase
VHHFAYRGGELYCEEVPLKKIAGEVGTPVYVYSRRTIVEHYRRLDEAFSGVPHLVCYSVKANSNLSVLSTLASLGAGADIVSGGELFRVLRAGIPPSRIVFAGVGKTEAEMSSALRAGILMFNVESRQEMHVLNEVAARSGLEAPVALRVNPDVDPETHPYIATGLREAKFGVGMREALELYEEARGLSHIRIRGVHQHIGSQITQVEPFRESVSRLRELVLELKARGLEVEYLNIGGGFGIPYRDEEVPYPSDYAEAIGPLVSELGCTLIMETGRMIVGNAGVLLTRVLYLKETGDKRFVVVDAAMNDLLRPALYHAYHEILPVDEKEGADQVVDVVGPVCETGDFLARERALPGVEPGELLAVMSAGAYGFTMSSNYNSRLRPAEVMVDGDRFAVVRERESYEDLIRGERVWP